MNEQHDYHVKEWRMAKAQSYLVWELYNELYRMCNVLVT